MYLQNWNWMNSYTLTATLTAAALISHAPAALETVGFRALMAEADTAHTPAKKTVKLTFWNSG